jgi:hypothetical protein
LFLPVGKVLLPMKGNLNLTNEAIRKGLLDARVARESETQGRCEILLNPRAAKANCPGLGKRLTTMPQKWLEQSGHPAGTSDRRVLSDPSVPTIHLPRV